MIVSALYVMVSIGRVPRQEGCDFIDFLCNGVNRRGLLCQFPIWCLW